MPYDLITPLEIACNNVLDYHRVSELAAAEAKYWQPYNNNKDAHANGGGLLLPPVGVGMPTPLITSLRTASLRSNSSCEGQMRSISYDGGISSSGGPSGSSGSSSTSGDVGLTSTGARAAGGTTQYLKAIPLKRVTSFDVTPRKRMFSSRTLHSNKKNAETTK